MRKYLFSIIGIGIIGAALFFGLTVPTAWQLFHATRDSPSDTPVDLANGRTQFLAGDCATCHASPGKADDTLLGGGRSLDTAFGIFHMPNISPDNQDGIGNWSLEQFILAMREGITPHGNAYPAFPYTSYQRMRADDLRDLFAYIKTLPAVPGKAAAHELNFPFSMRRGVGLWRLAFLDGKPLPTVPGQSDVWHRGRYLVEGAGHCAECHSPRNALGAIPADMRFSGGPNAERNGHVPNITPDDTGIGYWSVHDIASYLKEGVSPIGIKAGGEMKEVVANTARLSDADRLAMAVYLKTLPAVEAPNVGVPRPNRTAEVVRIAQRDKPANRSRLEALASTGTELAAADTLYVVTPTPFYLAPDGASEGGKLLGATRLNVLARENGMLKVRVDGWQQDGSDSAFHAMQGRRILQAVLSPEAIDKVARTRTVHDSATDQDWHAGTLTVWVREAGLSADLAQLWRHANGLFSSSCATCHALPHSEDFLANQWIGTLNAMKRYTSLDDPEYRLLLAWLQHHAKDTAPAAQGAKP